MSLEKSIKHGKEKRKRYYKSKAFDKSCRPNGGCGVCESNRKHSEDKRKDEANIKLNDYKSGCGGSIG